MLGFLITALISASIIYSIFTENVQALSNAVMTGCNDAVSLCIYLAGAMGLWGGIMNVADKCGITQKVTKLVSKPLRLLFRGLDDGRSMELISLNVTANLLGLGNAATPIGIQAMKRMCRSPEHIGRNMRHITMFVLLNTASIQLIPMTVSSMRLAHGAKDPWDCTLPTLLTSLASVAVGCVAVYMLYGKNRKEDRHEFTYASYHRRNIHNCSGEKG